MMGVIARQDMPIYLSIPEYLMARTISPSVRPIFSTLFVSAVTINNARKKVFRDIVILLNTPDSGIAQIMQIYNGVHAILM